MFVELGQLEAASFEITTFPSQTLRLCAHMTLQSHSSAAILRAGVMPYLHSLLQFHYNVIALLRPASHSWLRGLRCAVLCFAD